MIIAFVIIIVNILIIFAMGIRFLKRYRSRKLKESYLKDMIKIIKKDPNVDKKYLMRSKSFIPDIDWSKYKLRRIIRS